MPSSLGHALTAVAIGAVILPAPMPRRAWLALAACAALPDVDAIGRPFGYGDIAWLGGHRALTHSIPFCVLLAGVVTFIWFRDLPWSPVRNRVFTAVALGSISHGVLDAFTTYGTGVTFFAPFSWQRFQSSWQPFQALWPEVLILWMPSCLMLWITSRKWTNRRGRSEA